jgi:iron complex transport system substrate-binding protein
MPLLHDDHDPDRRLVVDELTRRRLLGGGLALGALTVAGCSTEDADRAAVPAGTSAGYPRTVGHAGGETVIESPPRRVLSDFNGPEFDALLSLGVEVAGRGEASGNPLYSWQEANGGADVPVLPYYGSNFEELRKADGDVLFMGELNDTALVDRIDDYQAILPVIALPLGFEEPLRIVAEVMDIDQGRVDDLVTERDALVAAFAPARRPESVVAFYWYDDGSFYLENDRGILHETLQLVGLPGLTAPPGDASYPQISTVALERVDLLEADLLLGLLDGDFDAAFDELERNPLFADLDVVRAGHYRRLTLDQTRSLSRTSPISLPVALDTLTDVLG